MVVARWESLYRSVFLRSILTLASANVVGQIILLAATPFVTRLYTPHDVGVFAAFNALMSSCLVASSLRYEFAIPLPRSERNGRLLVALSLILNGITCILAAVILFFWGRDLSQLVNVPQLASVLWLLPFVLFGAGSYKVFRMWAVRQHDFKAVAHTRILQSLANATLQIAGGVAGLGAVGLIIGQFFGFSAGLFRLARGSLDRSADLRRGINRRRVRVLARRYDRFPKFDVAGSVLDTVSTQFPNLLLAAMFGPVVAGFYSIADRVLGAPAGLLGQAIGQVLYARSRQALLNGTINRMVTVTVAGLSATLILPALIVFFFGASIFSLIFGEAWRQAGVFSSILVLGFAVQVVYSSISVLLLASEGQKKNLFIHAILLIVKIMAISYGYYVGDAYVAVMGYAVANGVGYACATALVILHVRTHSALTPDKAI